MARMGIEALYKKPNTSRKHPRHPIYPYLLRGLKIERANQVWAMDITYIPMARGFVYLAAVLDWHSRRVLAHRVSITMEADFCVAALEEAIARHGKPEIMNTDQGSQFSSLEFTDTLRRHGIAISMDGRGCWRDNVFVERLWKSIKYQQFIAPLGNIDRTDIGQEELAKSFLGKPDVRPSGMRAAERHHGHHVDVRDFTKGHLARVIAHRHDVAALVFALDLARQGFGIGLQIKGAADRWRTLATHLRRPAIAVLFEVSHDACSFPIIPTGFP